MCAKTRRVRLEIAAKDIRKIESLLGKEPLEIEIEVEENKSTFATLSQPEVINWEFVEEDSEEKDTIVDEKEEKMQSPVEYVPVQQQCKIIDTNDVVRFIEASWMTIRLHPGIRFNTELYNYNVQLKFDSLANEETRDSGLLVSERTVRAVSKMLIDIFYNGPKTEEEISEVVMDTINRIGSHFNDLKEADTLNKAMDILYRKDRI